MIAPRLIPRSEWERRLRDQHDCKRYDGGILADLETGEWWVTKNDSLFVVPIDNEDRIRSDDYQKVVVEIAKLRPLNWDT